MADGKHYALYHFLNYAQESNYRIGQDELTGCEGFRYELGVGVTVHFVWKDPTLAILFEGNLSGSGDQDFVSSGSTPFVVFTDVVAFGEAYPY